jgi:hypothetical protein
MYWGKRVLPARKSNGLITFLGLPTRAPLFTLFTYEPYSYKVERDVIRVASSNHLGLRDSEMLMCVTRL